jgi:hypothetical protein
VKRSWTILTRSIAGLLFVIAGCGWVRSRSIGDDLGYEYNIAADTTRAFGFAHGGGDFTLLTFDVKTNLSLNLKPRRFYHNRLTTYPVRTIMPDYVHGLFGYGWLSTTHFSSSAMERYRAIVLPYWLLMTPFAVVVARNTIGYRRRRAARLRGEGRCVRCGYDLRATPELCPECGASARIEAA